MLGRVMVGPVSVVDVVGDVEDEGPVVVGDGGDPI